MKELNLCVSCLIVVPRIEQQSLYRRVQALRPPGG